MATRKTPLSIPVDQSNVSESDVQVAASEGVLPTVPQATIQDLLVQTLGPEEANRVPADISTALQAVGELWTDHIVELVNMEAQTLQDLTEPLSFGAVSENLTATEPSPALSIMTPSPKQTESIPQSNDPSSGKRQRVNNPVAQAEHALTLAASSIQNSAQATYSVPLAAKKRQSRRKRTAAGGAEQLPIPLDPLGQQSMQRQLNESGLIQNGPPTHGLPHAGMHKQTLMQPRQQPTMTDAVVPLGMPQAWPQLGAVAPAQFSNVQGSTPPNAIKPGKMPPYG